MFDSFRYFAHVVIPFREGFLFSFSISISPHTSVKCKINRLAAKTKLVSKQWWERVSAETSRRPRRVRPPLSLYRLPSEMAHKNRVKYSGGKIIFRGL